MEFGPILKSLRNRKAFTALIILQIAITLMALTISVIVTSTTLREWNLPSGLDHQNLVAVYPQIFDENLVLQDVINHDIEVMKNIPGVTLVTPAINIPFSAQNVREIYTELGEKAQSYQTNFFDFDENAIDVLGVEVKAGRNLTAADVIKHDPLIDNMKPSVVMISESMAEAMFDGENAIEFNLLRVLKKLKRLVL